MENNSIHSSESSFELTENQKGLWFLYKVNPTDSSYNLPFAFRIYSALNIAHFKHCCKILLDKHPMLRVRFFEKDGMPYQIIQEKSDVDYTYVDASKLDDDELKNEVNAAAFQPFNLESDAIFRVHLYHLNENNSVLLFNFHHIASDAHSYYVVFDEFFKLYGKEQLLSLNTDENSYHDYALAEKKWINSESAEKSLNFWQSEVSGDIPTLQLPPIQTEFTNANEKSENCYHYFEFHEQLIEKIDSFAKKNNATLYTVLLAAYKILLSKYSGQQDIIVGSPVSGRADEKFSNTFGYCINVVPIRTHIDQNTTFSEYLRLIFTKTREVIEHQKYPIALLIKNLKILRQSEGHPLFQTIFSIQRTRLKNADSMTSMFKTGTRVALGGIEFENFFLENNKSQFNLDFVVRQSSKNITGLFIFDSKILDRNFIERFTNNLKVLLESIAKSTNETIANLKYINESEYKQIVEDWNSTHKSAPVQKTVHALFEEQALKTPNNTALVYENIELSYLQLNERANQLAHYLIKTHNIQPDTLLTLCLERSEVTIIAILAVLKAGGAYVPIDPNYPSERIQYIVNDTNSPLLLTDALYRELQPSLNLEPKTNPITTTTSSHLAYVIYTSGTTGTPKGVMIEHRGAVNVLSSYYWIPRSSRGMTWSGRGMTNQTKIGAFASYIFDASFKEFFVGLLAGGELHLFSDRVRSDVTEMAAYIIDKKINHLHIPPALLSNLPKKNYETLHGITCGGEACDKLSATYWSQTCNLYNCYGPTETSIEVVRKRVINGDVSLIGSPIQNTRCYVLSPSLAPLPIGATGELYIGGIGLARGYLNQPQLTAEKFISNPFQTENEKKSKQNERLYKTGDLVRWMPDGNLEYVGRADLQVKIRGFRIELGEIENALLSFHDMSSRGLTAGSTDHLSSRGLTTGSTYHLSSRGLTAGASSLITQSVVLVKNSPSTNETLSTSAEYKYLVGYYVSKSKLDEIKITEFLQTKLPEYMIPATYVHLEKLPLTVNGKIDKKALPDPQFTSEDSYVAPRNNLEKQICQVWANVLELSEDKIGVRDDFFRLGGNSILAIRLVSRINKLLVDSAVKPRNDIQALDDGVSNIHISTIFKQKTIEKLTQYLREQNKTESINITSTKVNKVSEQKLSFAQERLWFIEKYEEGTNVYNIPLVYKLSKHVQHHFLEESLNSILSRHEILRTLIKEDNFGNAYQLVCNEPIALKKITAKNKIELLEMLKQDVNHIYNLSAEYPIRACVYELDVERYLSVVIHHIAFDGWSVDLFLNELNAHYDYYQKKSEGFIPYLELPLLTVQYKDFALWQKNYLTGEIENKQLDFWKSQLSGYDTLNLKIDKPRPPQINYQGKNIYFEFGKDLSENLRTLAKELKVSLYSVLLSGYSLMLKSFSYQDDFVIGTTMANRHYAQVEHLIGFFVNSLALRIRINATESISEFIQRMGNEVIEAQLYQDLPFEKLVAALNITQDQSRHPIFQVMFNVQNFGKQNVKQYGSCAFSQDDISILDDTPLFEQDDIANNLFDVAKFDLTTTIDDTGSQLKCVFNYATSLYTETTITHYIETYIAILKQLVVIPQLECFLAAQARAERLPQVDRGIHTTLISELNYLPQKQYTQVIELWNKTDRPYPEQKTIHALFEDQVLKTPNTLALVYENTELSYLQLNEKSNQLAHYLKDTLCVEPDTLVALYLDRSEHMIIAILAILKAGGAYVPMDPNYPDERTQYILQDTNTSVILTNVLYQQKLESIWITGSNHAGHILCLDNYILQNALQQKSTQNPHTQTTSAHLAYIIYTSGTTGKPKGVMVEHQGVVNTIRALDELYDCKNGNKFTAFTSYTFDASVSEFWTALFNGGELHLLNEQVRSDVSVLSDYLLNKKINYAYLPPAILPVLPKKQYELDVIMYAGEPCDAESGKYWSTHSHLYNYYGITEISIHATGKKVMDGDVNLIGVPIANTQCFVLDAYRKPLPIGAVGELYVGGPGVARGYLNRPDLTAERFIQNPFQTELEKKSGKNARLYKSGDLVRWLSDGNLEYIGRADFQVKIRGFRIELGEIENALLSFHDSVSSRSSRGLTAGATPLITQAIVLAKDHILNGKPTGNKYLVGYYVSNIKLNDEHIFAYLQTKLPEYMMPSALVYLEKLPLTINGKTDKKALPEPQFTSQDSYVAPRNDLEKQICQVWAEVLGLPQNKIGIRDDFFRLGGDSIISIQFVSRLRQKLNLHASVKDIFNYKTIEKLYDCVFSKIGTQKSELKLKSEQGQLQGEVPLLPIQQWFFDNQFIKPHHWNQSFVIKTPELDFNRLSESVGKLVGYHDAFRLRYKKDEFSHVIQYYEDPTTTPYHSAQACDRDVTQGIQLRVLDIKTLNTKDGHVEEIQKIFTTWQNEFNFETGPLFCVGYVHGYADKTARVYFALHHLIVDTISWRILTQDLMDLYHNKQLGSKGSSYRQWVNTIHHYSHIYPNEKLYWENIVADYNPQTLSSRGQAAESTEKHEAHMSLNALETQKLLRDCNPAYNTKINDLLLTALAYALSECTNHSVNHIVLEGHGREDIDKEIDITRSLGWFTTMYPVRLEKKDNLPNTLKSIKETLRKVPNNGIGYGALFGYQPEILPKISFNYLGQFEHSDTNHGKHWNILSEASGVSIHADNQDSYILHVNGGVFNEELQFTVSGRLNPETIASCASHFGQKLKDIIHHTTTLSTEGIYLANSLQQGFVYHALSQGEDDAYRVQIVWNYKNSLDTDLLKQSWQLAQQKYPSLRLRFEWDEQIVQVIDKQTDLNWTIIDLTTETELSVQETKIKQILKDDRLLPFDLGRSGLFRLYLIKQTENLYTCIFSNHHAILDGWSMPILFGFVHESYIKLKELDSAVKPRNDITFTVDHSYANAQQYLEEHREATLSFWNETLSQLEEKCDLGSLLKFDSKYINLQEYKHVLEPKEQEITFENKRYVDLKECSKKYGITLNAIFQYAWHKTLSLYGHNTQTVVGTTVSGRNLPIDHIENSVGLYINTLPLIVNHSKYITVLDAIKNIQNSIHDLNDNSSVSLAKLQKDGVRLFDTIFVYENYPQQAPTYENELKIHFKEVVEKADYPLCVIAHETHETHEAALFKLRYAGELFNHETLESLLSVTENLISQIISDPTKEIQKLSYLPQTHYAQVIELWNKTERPYPDHKTIHALFEAQVLNTPNDIALVYENVELSYEQLNEKSNQLAHYLIKKYNIQPDSMMTLCLERSEIMIIAILAILKAGGAYVPIDPNYPSERIQYIVKDTNSPLLLTNDLYSKLQPLLNLEPKTNPVTTTTQNHLAYVIYTSGTTGTPKGVMIEHGGVVNVLSSYCWIPRSSRGMTRIGAFASYIFDASFKEFFVGLLAGGELHLFSDRVKSDVTELAAYIIDKKINYLHIPPALLSDLPKKQYETLCAIICGGESCDKISATYWSQVCNLYNCYGPTETSIEVVRKHVINGDVSVIGTPLPNTKCYVLDSNLAPLPIGATGELYIGGVGLARGYLNQPNLTAEKFIANPFQTDIEKKSGENARLYKSGDLVRWLSDGNLEYIGRADSQVKIRGFRIELGEIENALLSFQNSESARGLTAASSSLITKAVVLTKDHINNGKPTGNKYLVGYYVSKIKLNEEQIFAHLKTKLPEYMIPNTFIHLEKLPLTINGKIDKKKLPDPQFTSENPYVVPRHDLEKQICQIWAEVLGLPQSKIGIRDDFFRLGGDSIISIQFVSRLRQKLNLHASVKDIFNYKTIEKLYDNIFSKIDDEKLEFKLKSEQGQLKGEAPFLPIQQWFFDNRFVNAHHWNQSFIIKTPELDFNQLCASVAKLVEYHDAFRLRYKKDEFGNLIQHYNTETQKIECKILDVSTLMIMSNDTQGTKENCVEFNAELQKIFTTWQSGFNLEVGPLACIGYVHGFADKTARIYFALHHLIVDAIGWRILTQDLKDLYHKKQLGPKSSSYRQWANAIRDYANIYPNEKEYWANVVADYEPQTLSSLGLTAGSREVDSTDKSLNDKHVAQVSLSAHETQKLLRNCHSAYNTQINDLLLTAFTYALSECTNKSVNHIVLEGHGREDIDKEMDVTRTLGWFTTMYPVRLEKKDSLAKTIKSIKETLRKVPNKGVGYGALFGYQLEALPKISFNYLGQFDQSNANSEKQNWNIVNEPSGIQVYHENKDNYFIVNGGVFNGELQFTINARLNPETINLCASHFEQKLKDIIHHTTTLSTEGVYLANSLQQGFIYHALSQNEDDAYRVQTVWNYENKIDADVLKQSWVYAQQKYPVLRLRFEWDDQIVQIIDKQSHLNWTVIDLSSQKELSLQEEKIKEILANDRLLPFDLGRGGLFRLYLVKQTEDLYTCIFSCHHAILDGWSSPILFGFVHETYVKLKGMDSVVKPRNDIQNEARNDIQNKAWNDTQKIAFTVDQSYINAQQYIEEHQEHEFSFWNSSIAQLEERTDLSCLLKNHHKHVNLHEYKHVLEPKEHFITFQHKRYSDLKECTKKYGITVNAMLQYAWHKTLSVYGHNNQTVVGTTVSGRNLPIDNIENSVGLYINTLPLIVNHSKSLTVLEAIKTIQDSIHDLNSNSTISLAQLQKNGVRLFDSMFVYENYPAQISNQNDLKICFKEVVEKADYPLSVIAYEISETIYLKLKYAGELFSHEAVESFLSVTENLIFQMVSDPNQEIKNLSYLPQKQYAQVIELWNQTEKNIDGQKTIHALFEEQVLKTPNNVALIYQDIELTYGELNKKVNQLAHYLKHTFDIQPDTPIALILDRSEHMLIAILAILKSGGAYVPIDPNYPDERIQYILQDTNTQIILTDEIFKQKWEHQSTENPITDCTSSHLAYIIYTSGTTGQPKGVMIEHKGVVDRIQWHNSLLPLHESDRILQKTPYVFDPSVIEFFWPIWYGACVVVAAPEGHKDVDYLIDLIEKSSITTVGFVPSMFQVFLDKLNTPLPTLRYLICGGEQLPLNQVKQCHHVLPHIELHNLYGPTETSIVALSYNCTDQNQETIYIGKPIHGTTVYVLDDQLSPVPIGAIGELHIGGVGLARGYLNNPTLTAEKFISNPFQTHIQKKLEKNATLYKTGDLVRFSPDGNLEYMGRTDFQIKIRGFRVELEEIENALLSFHDDMSARGLTTGTSPLITQCVVLAKEYPGTKNKSSENKYLVGYYVSKSKLNETKILEFLQTKLPEHMIPAVLVHLEKLPFTINEKVDKKALPEPEFAKQDSYIAPRNDFEKQICQIWADVLGLSQEKVGIQDDFFKLGGNSILAIRLVSNINKLLMDPAVKPRDDMQPREPRALAERQGSIKSQDDSILNINVKAIFTHKTIEKLTQYLSEQKNLDSNVDSINITPITVAKVEEQILSFAQERLWFIEKYENGTNAYNIPMVYKLSNHVQYDLLKESLNGIILRHEILRTLIKADNLGNSYQFVSDKPLEIKKYIVTNETQFLEMLNQNAHHTYNLSEEYPIKVCVYEFNCEMPEQYLSIVIHHIAFDGWSVDIFLKELNAHYSYYQKKSEGLNPYLKLPALTVQYKDFAIAQRNYLTGETLAKQLSFWKKQLSGYETLNLKTDKPRPLHSDFQGHNVYFEFDQDLSKNLRELAKELKVSLYSLLLSGYSLMLKSFSHQSNFVVGTPVANRHYTQIENLIGFFINSLPIRIQINSNESIFEFIQRIAHETIQTQLHQDLPFEKLVSELNVNQDQSRHPIFQVMFSVQNFGRLSIENENEVVTNWSMANHLYTTAKFDLATSIDDSSTQLKCVFNYATSLFTESTISHYIETYIAVLKQFIAIRQLDHVIPQEDHVIPQESHVIPQEGHVIPRLDRGIHSPTLVSNLIYLPQKQYAQVIELWNKTEHLYEQQKTIHALFEEQALKTPNNTALIYENVELSYAQLNERANELAHYLIKTYNVQPDTLITLCLERSEVMLIAILAVLKASAAYVPIDPHYPSERIQYIVRDTNSPILLTEKMYRELQPLLTLEQKTNPITKATSHHLAYVIYTSGTTGTPKGVMIEHKAVANILQWHNHRYPLEESDKILQKTPYVFDPSLIEFFCPIWSGASIVFAAPEGHKDVDYLIDLIEKNGITFAAFVPSMFQVFLDRLDSINKERYLELMDPAVILRNDDNKILSTLRYLFCGGESLHLKQVQQCQKVLSHAQFHNMYGPTEASIIALTYDCANSNQESICIGKPIHNTTAYVLNEQLSPLPIGAIGELYLGGVGLSRGYLNNPTLTAEKFIPNHFQTTTEKNLGKNTTLYKTGDLVRWLDDGNLEYIGRTDFQIKIRGFRVELEEIESALLSSRGSTAGSRSVSSRGSTAGSRSVSSRGSTAGSRALSDPFMITQCIVIAKEHINLSDGFSDSKYLVAYYVSESKLDETKIIEHLQTKLPPHMIPAAFVHLEKLPLTINGKVDRNALPNAEFTKQDSYVASRNEFEKQICQIWAEVLGLPEEKVGIRDDFFRLGGNSILAIRLVHRLNKMTLPHSLVEPYRSTKDRGSRSLTAGSSNPNIGVSTIFNHKTIEQLTRYLETQTHEDVIAITKSKISNPKDQLLSFAQERLWFIEKYEDGTNAYNIPMLYKLSSHVQCDLLENGLNAVISRHEILRTLIKEDNQGNTYQWVCDDPLNIKNVSVKDKTELLEMLKQDVNHIYNLSTEYPIRAHIYELDAERYLSVVIHHIAFDGWSVDIFLKELNAHYVHYQKKSDNYKTSPDDNVPPTRLELPTLTVQYKDFALWQRNYLSGERVDKQLNFWKNKLGGYETLNLKTDKPRPLQIDYQGKNIYFEFNQELSENLRELAKELNVSLYSLLLAGYSLMLKSFSYQDDFVIGTPVANRHYSQIENLIGFFINSLAIRIQINSKESLSSFIQRLGNETAQAQLYQDLPFEKLVSELNVKQDQSRHPIFQVMFSVQNFGNQNQNSDHTENLTSLFQQTDMLGDLYTVAKFDLTTFIDDSSAQLRCMFNYATSLFTEITINQYKETYIEILQQFAAIPRLDHVIPRLDRGIHAPLISELTYLPQKQYAQVIELWNKTEQIYPEQKTVHSLFEEQVERTPNHTALVYENVELTYEQLNEKSNQLAHYLIKTHSIQPDTMIALCLERTEVTIISILAVLKAGGAYVPLDPNYPSERIQYITQDTNSPILLTDKMYNELQSSLNLEPKTNPVTATTSNHLAYVIYTSGTTGTPKGVMIEHRGVVNVLSSYCWIPRSSRGMTWSSQGSRAAPACAARKHSSRGMTHQTKIGAFASYIFDASFKEFFVGLLAGGELHLFSDRIRTDIVEMSQYIIDKKINYLHIPPALLPDLPKKQYETLCGIICGGESCDKPSATYWSQICHLYNCYGPTETSIEAVRKLMINGDVAVIGTPIPNTKCYVLDSNLAPLPIGATGELYIGGVGLARGYLNQPELTTQKFMTNPFQIDTEKNSGKNSKLYKTGDLVRWLHDGNLEYIQRVDFQVKIRGFRIELGEIENALLSFHDLTEPCSSLGLTAGSSPLIIQTVVLARERTDIKTTSGENKYLVAYYVSEFSLNEEKITTFLQTKLPEYMIPSAFVHLEKLPLTINGKIDVKALPEPEFITKDSYIAPRNEFERQICEMWAEILELPKEKVGIQNDFFKLGGNSILAIRILTKMNHFYRSNLKLTDFFLHKNVQEIAPKIIKTKKYQAVTKINNTENGKNLFMIHPGNGGSEVYISLANRFNQKFSCYGVDYYNLYHENKIENLHDMAQYYLTHIDTIMKETNQTEFNLLGWSLGGTIAMEIAAILEGRGVANIKIYLLDTRHVNEHIDIPESETRKHFLSQGYDNDYIDKLIPVINVESKLVCQGLASHLSASKILLFKAMLKDTRFQSHDIQKQKQASNLKFNNIDKVVKNKSSITVIKMDNAHHGNILEQENLLVNHILDFETLPPKTNSPHLTFDTLIY